MHKKIALFQIICESKYSHGSFLRILQEITKKEENASMADLPAIPTAPDVFTDKEHRDHAMDRQACSLKNKLILKGELHQSIIWKVALHVIMNCGAQTEQGERIYKRITEYDIKRVLENKEFAEIVESAAEKGRYSLLRNLGSC